MNRNLKYVVKIGYEQFNFKNDDEALAFAQNAKDSIVDEDVTIKIIIEYDDPEEVEVVKIEEED